MISGNNHIPWNPKATKLVASMEQVWSRMSFIHPTTGDLKDASELPVAVKAAIEPHLKQFRRQRGWKKLDSKSQGNKCNNARLMKSRPDVIDNVDVTCGYCQHHGLLCSKATPEGKNILLPRPEHLRGDATWDDPDYWVRRTELL